MKAFRNPRPIEQERRQMKSLTTTALVLLGCLSIDPALAQPPGAPSPAPGVADAIKQRVRDWCDAMITDDVDKLSRILADDWVDGYPGKQLTKAAFVDLVKSGKHQLQGCEFGPMDVKVLGDVAVIQGSVTEKRIRDGKAGSVRVAFMDVFMKRGDRWVAVRSHAHKL